MSTKIFRAPARLCLKILNGNNIVVQNSTLNNLRMRSTSSITQNQILLQNKTTVDKADVAVLEKHKSSWWDPNGPMRPLHAYNAIRIPFFRDGIYGSHAKTMKPLQGKQVLEVGCGGGLVTEPLAKLGACMTGIDASAEIIEVARRHSENNPKLKDNQPNYICTTIEEHSAQCCDHYDAVIASEVIEHVDNQELFLKSCVNALKPGGRIFITTPTRTRINQFVSIFLAERMLQIIPKGVHQYEKFMTANEVTFLLERNNCQVELVHGIMFNPFTNTWSWISSQHFFFAIQAVKH